jgi:hypothetical protein
MPILGIIASQDYNRVTNSYESIATTTLGSSSATITFSSIPATYTHLQIRGITRCTKADTSSENVVVALNSDSTYTNYRTHYLDGDGTGVAVGALQVSAFYSNAGLTISNNATANVFSATIIDILDYTNTNKNTTVRVLTGIDTNGYGQVRLASSLWLNTSAVNALTFNPRSAGDFAQYSQFALYGIK